MAPWLVAAVAIYFIVSMTVFRFRHPWLTETQLFMHIPEAVTWRKLD